MPHFWTYAISEKNKELLMSFNKRMWQMLMDIRAKEHQDF